MNIYNLGGCQERIIQQNHGLKFDSQEKPNQMGIFQEGSFGPAPAPANSSTTIMSQIGSPGSAAFYATEIYMGFTQYDYQHSFCPQIPNNFDAQIPDQSLQQTNPNPNLPSLQSAAQPNSCINNQYRSTAPDKYYSEREQILQLKRKLLGDDYETPDKRQASVPFDGKNISDLSLSRNPYGYQLAHTRQSAATCGNAAAPCVISSKTRIRWTQDLHDRFVECVNHLGGAEKATPKAILRLMDSEALTIYHVKSHLQKYRIAKYMPDSAQGKSEKRTSMNDVDQQMNTKTGMQLREALQLQLDVQRRLHDQLEIQRNLQLRIEEQGKQLKLMFDQQQKTTYSALDPTSSSTSNELDVEVLIAKGCENSQCPSKID